MKKLIHGVALIFLAIVFTRSARGESPFEVLHSFEAGYPNAALIEASDGRFYGTTRDGVFKITPAGELTTLHSFSGSGPNAAYAALIEASDGSFYGTTVNGGAGDRGTVFKITPAGELTTLHSFSGPDGSDPNAALIEASDGSFYGTTEEGGAGNAGTVFRITPSGELTTLHSFSGPDGFYPEAALIEASDGSFYGTTGTEFARGAIGGTVFRITPSGELTTLHSFSGPDGSDPIAALIEASDGSFYGTTRDGGAFDGGTVFKITPAGELTTVHSFSGPDGSDPNAALIEASDGSFYGTTRDDGAFDGGTGTVFRITPAGELTTLHSFNGPDGSSPYAALIETSDGNFYGTTYSGGARGGGVVFRQGPIENPLRGDCNGDGKLDISDGICNLDWLFTGKATPGCIAALNTNGDERVDLADAVWLLNFLFAKGSQPVGPFPACGLASLLPSDFVLGCATPPKICE